MMHARCKLRHGNTALKLPPPLEVRQLCECAGFAARMHRVHQDCQCREQRKRVLAREYSSICTVWKLRCRAVHTRWGMNATGGR
eukprot:2078282-Pleurochrysis_carterae.AAC.2